MTPSDWAKLVLGIALFVLGVAGLAIAITRHYINTMAKEKALLFNFANDHEARIVTLEKWVLTQDPTRTVFLKGRK